jgi:hypothetical protein
MKIAFALVVWIVGYGIAVVWLRAFWRDSRRVPAPVILGPAAAALLGLGGWAGYDFVFGHWVGDISFAMFVLNLFVLGALLVRRSVRFHEA